MRRDKTIFRVGLDDEVVAMLIEVASERGRPPQELIEDIVRDVLADDALAHEPTKLH